MSTRVAERVKSTSTIGDFLANYGGGNTQRFDSMLTKCAKVIRSSLFSLTLSPDPQEVTRLEIPQSLKSVKVNISRNSPK